MEFRKERNLISAYDGVLKLGAWNITTGEFIGKSGKVVKTVPKCFTYDNLPSHYDRRYNDVILFGYIIRCYRSWANEWGFEYTEQRGNRLEQLLSLGLRPGDLRDLDNDTALTKDLVTYVNEHGNGIFRRYVINEYLTTKKYKDFLNGKPDWIISIFKNVINDYPYDYVKSILNRVTNEHVNSFMDSSSILGMVKKYYSICQDMYGKVEIHPNILSNYAQLIFLYEQYKQQHYNEEINKHNNKPWLYYQDDAFIVRPILSKEDFHNEGERQHNCVERWYMERVHNGDTHIVTVRRVENPDLNYITCEVSNNGKIVQYLAACNASPREQDAREFYHTYQEYLNENFTKD